MSNQEPLSLDVVLDNYAQAVGEDLELMRNNPEAMPDYSSKNEAKAAIEQTYTANSVVLAAVLEIIGEDDELLGAEIYPSNVKLAIEHNDKFRMLNNFRKGLRQAARKRFSKGGER